MDNAVPARIANILMNALKSGVVPRVGLEYITVGRAREIAAILNDIDLVSEGSASFRFIVGKYGSGKSFLLQTIRNYATARGFAVVDADLSPERRFSGTKGQGLATYKELIQNLSTKSKPDGGALPLVLERWLSGIQASIKASTDLDGKAFNREVERQIYAVTCSLEGMVNGFEFAKAVSAYWEGHLNDDQTMKNNVLKWFRGEYATRKEAREDLGINLIITDDTWYDFLKIFAVFLVGAGYRGLLVFIDELVNLYKIPHSITRQNNYEKLLTMFNDVLQGKARYIGFLMGGTPQCIEDKYRGLFSYEALKSRLAEGRYAADGLRDLSAPIIRLEMLSQEELYVLVEKLRDIHSLLHGYNTQLKHQDLVAFLTVEFNRVGAGTHITPREIIRDFIELLNILHQNPSKTPADIMGSDAFVLSAGGLTDEDIHSEFSEFEV
ncbi:MAG: ATP-binding protein [Clostridia bacterium]|nr:ATP-binding protein [Clostridia bacterium]